MGEHHPALSPQDAQALSERLGLEPYDALLDGFEPGAKSDAIGVLFALFLFTGNARYKRLGLRVVAATLVAAFGFFAVLTAVNLLE